MVADEARTVIEDANRRLREGIAKGDASIFTSVYAEDAIAFPPDAPVVRGKQAIHELWGAVIASGVKEADLATDEMVGDGEFVIERGTGVLKVQPAGEAPSEQRIKYVVAWKRTAEGWKNYWDIWNRSP
jgi:ketosteroid isomerase-like protein